MKREERERERTRPSRGSAAQPGRPASQAHMPLLSPPFQTLGRPPLARFPSPLSIPLVLPPAPPALLPPLDLSLSLALVATRKERERSFSAFSLLAAPCRRPATSEVPRPPPYSHTRLSPSAHGSRASLHRSNQTPAPWSRHASHPLCSAPSSALPPSCQAEVVHFASHRRSTSTPPATLFAATRPCGLVTGAVPPQQLFSRALLLQFLLVATKYLAAGSSSSYCTLSTRPWPCFSSARHGLGPSTPPVASAALLDVQLNLSVGHSCVL